MVSPEQLERMVEKIGVGDDQLVSVHDFVREQTKDAPTQAVPTAIFFMQTLGLILKDTDFFGALGALNLDLESATGQVRKLLSIDTNKWHYDVGSEYHQHSPPCGVW